MSQIDLGQVQAHVSVGTVTTGEAGTDASVVNSGTSQNAILDFTIPRGAKGDTGDIGPAGPQGPMGPSGYSGAAEDLEVVQVSGDSASAVMSQKAVTDELNTLSENLQDVEDELNDINIKTANKANTDLDIADEYGNVLVKFANGHVKTKNFNSENDTPLSDGNTNAGDLEFTDEHNHCIVRFSDGQIQTKNFNSAQIDNTLAKFNGKSLGIIGDSISTFSGWLPSDISGYDGTTYATYYPYSPLTSVEQTWWYKVASHLGINITKISNCSWSGSRVSGDSTSINNAYAGCSTRRITDLAARGFIPNIIIVFISCNDWGNSPVVPVGTWQVSDAIPNEGIITTMREAYALMLNKIHMTYPLARVFCCTNLDDFSRDATSGWPSNNSQGISTYQWNQNIKEIAEAFGCDVIDVHSCGINYSNIHDYYAVDAGLHPNDAGHTLIANRVISELKNKF